MNRPLSAHRSKAFLLLVGVVVISACGGSDDSAINRAPTANAGSDATKNAGELVTLDGSGSSDAGNGTIASYSWTQQSPGTPTVDLVNASAAMATFTAPDVTQNTTFVFQLTVADDGGLTHTDEVSIIINARPTARAGDNRTVNARDTVTLAGSGSDPGGGTVTYSWMQASGTPVTLSAADIAMPIFTIPTLRADTTLNFVLTVTDAGGLTATDEVSIMVRALLSAIAGDDQNAGSGATVTLDGSNSFAPGDAPITYSWTQTSGPPVTLSATDIATPTFTAPEAAPGVAMGTTRLEFQLEVEDADGLTHADSVAILAGKVDTLSMDGHDGAVRGVAVSRDGRLAVSGGLDGTVRLWNANIGEEILFDAASPGGGRSLGRHAEAVYAVAISADGNRAISGGYDGTVRLWDTDAGTEVRYPIPGGSNTRSLGRAGIWVYAVALNADGSRAASGGFDGKVRLWNTAATGTGAGEEITYPVANGSSRRSLGGHGSTNDDGILISFLSVYAVALSDDGNRVLSGGADGAVRLWNADTGVQERSLGDQAMGPVYGVALSGDGRLAAAGSADDRARVWNADTGDETHELVGHGADVSSVSLNADKTRLLSVGGDGTARLWNVDANDANDNRQIRALRRHTNYAWSAGMGAGIAMSGDADGTLVLWDTTTLPSNTTKPFKSTEPVTVPGNPNQTGDVVWWQISDDAERVRDASLSADGLLALLGSDTVRLWDTTSDTLLRNLSGDEDRFRSVVLSANGRFVLSGDSEGNMELWDATSGNLLRSMSSSRHGAVAVALSTDGRFALSGDGHDGTVRFWDATTGDLLRTMDGHTDGAIGVALNADGSLALSSNSDGTARLWDTTSGSLLHVLSGHASRISKELLTANGHLALSGDRSGFIHIWDTASGALLRTMRGGSTYGIDDMALSADGRLALSVSDSDMRLWDTASGELLRSMHGHQYGISSASMSADGRLLLSAGNDNTLRLWRIGRSHAASLPPTVTARAGDDQTTGTGVELTLAGSGSVENGEPVAYSWQQTSGPAVALSANNIATVTFVTPIVAANTRLDFAFTVTSPRGLTATDETSVIINLRPGASAGDDQAVVTGAEATLTGSGSGDPGGGDIDYHWTQTGGTPTVTLSDADAERPTFATPTVTSDTTLNFVLTVTDAGGLTATDEVSVVVRASLSAIAGDDQNVGSGATVTLDGSNSGAPGGAPITYSWRQTSGPTVKLSAADVATPTFTAPEATLMLTAPTIRLEFQLEVEDADGLAHADSVAILVGKADTLSMDDHGGAVRGVAVGRNGRRAVSGGADGTVRLWNANTGEEVLFDVASPDGGRSLGRHDGEVYAVAISADGGRAISGGYDGTVRLWDTDAGTEVRYPIPGDSNTRSLGRAGIWVYAVALNADGNRAASGGFDGKVRLWNTETTGTGAGEEITYPTADGSSRRSLGGHTIMDDGGTPGTDDDTTSYFSVYAVSLSDDGNRVLSGGADGTVRLWNTTTGTRERSLGDQSMGPVYGVALSGDGRLAAAGSADDRVRVWNANTGDETHRLVGHGADVSSVALSTDKTRLLSVGGDGTARLWNVDANDAGNNRHIHALRRHADYAWSAGLSGDGNIALSGGADGTLVLWDTATTPTDTQEPFESTEPDTAPSDPNRRDGLVRRQLGGNIYAARNVSLSADGRLALSHGYALHLWDTTSGRLLHTLSEGTEYSFRAALSANGHIAASDNSEGNLMLWDTTTGNLLRSMNSGTMQGTYGVALNVDGSIALSSDLDNVMHLWDVTSGNLLRTLGSTNTNVVSRVAISLDGRTALSASGSSNGIVHLWDATSGELLRTMSGHTSWITDVAMNANGHLILSGSEDNTVRLWDATSGELLQTMSDSDASGIISVALSADGRIALSGNEDGIMSLWDATSGELLRSTSGSLVHGVNSVALSADARIALSAGSDNTMRLWHIGRSHAAGSPSAVTARAGDDQTVGVGVEVTLSGSGRSNVGNGEPVAYFWRQTAGPTVALSSDRTAIIAFTTPIVTANTSLGFAFTVTGPRGLTATDEVSVIINLRPGASAGDDQAVVTGAEATLTGSGSGDPGGGDIDYRWTQTGGAPEVTLSDATAERPTFATPTVTSDTTLNFVLTVTDAGGLTATDEVSVVVRASLSAIAGDDQNVGSGATVTLDGSNSGAPGGAPITYSWTQTSGPTVTLSAADVATPTFTAPEAASMLTAPTTRLEFQLEVEDADGLTHADSVAILVGKVDTLSMGAHDGTVRGVALSRDGRLAVSGGLDGTVRLWNANTGEEILFDAASPGGKRSLGRHDGEVYVVAISADGGRAISGGYDGTVRLWDTDAGTEVRYPVPGGSDMRSLGRAGIWVYAVALNADGSRAASGGLDGRVRLWNTETTGADVGEEITYSIGGSPYRRSLGSHANTNDGGTPDTDDDTTSYFSVYAVSLSDDGTRVLSGGADGTVRLWDATTGVEERGLGDQSMGPVYGVALSSDGTVAAAGSADDRVRVWNADTGDETHRLVGHGADVSGVALSADKAHLLSVGGDGTARLWNVDANDGNSNRQIHALRRHTDYAWSAGLSGNGNVALSGGDDGTLVLWDTATTPMDATEPFESTEPDTMPGDLNRTDGVAWRELGDDTSTVIAVALSADGRLALSGGSAHAPSLWDTASGNLLRTLSDHGNLDYYAAALSAGGHLALLGGEDGALRLWDATSGNLLQTMHGSTYGNAYGGTYGVGHAALSADGHFALSGSSFSSIVHLWDSSSGTLLHDMDGHMRGVSGTALSADGRLALSSSGYGDLRLWETSSGNLLRTLSDHTHRISSAALSADGHLALSSDGYSTVHLLDTTSGELRHTLDGHQYGISSMALSADGRLALSGDGNGTIRLWDATFGVLLRVLHGHRGGISDAALSADGRTALSANYDGPMRLWHIGRSRATGSPSTVTALAGDDQTVGTGVEVTLSGSGSSNAGSGEPVAYFWRQTAGPAVTLSVNNAATATFTAPTVAGNTTLNFKFTITDARRFTATDEVTITVSPPASGNASPSLVGTAPRSQSSIASATQPDTHRPDPKTAPRLKPILASDAASNINAACISRVDEAGRTLHGRPQGKHCVYAASFLSADNPLHADMTIFSLPDGGAHIFQGSLVVGHELHTNADLAEAGIARNGDGAVLTVEAGTTIAFENPSSSLVINQGSRLLAVGTAERPITLTSRGDIDDMDMDGNFDSPDAPGPWNGLKVNGFGDNNNEDDSGRIEFMVIKHADASGVELRDVGSRTVIQNLQVYAAFGDGISLDGGAASIENVVVVYALRDSIDLSGNWSGSITNALVIEPEHGGNHCLDARDIGGSENMNPATIKEGAAWETQGRPFIGGLTCIMSPGSTSDGVNALSAGIRLETNTMPVITRSMIVGIYAADTPTDDADTRADYCLSIDNHPPQDATKDLGGAFSRAFGRGGARGALPLVEKGTRGAKPFDMELIPGSPVLTGNVLTGNVFACGNKTDGNALPNGTTLESWVANGNNQFADVAVPTDPTSANDTQLQLLEGAPPVYSLNYDRLRVNGSDTTITAPTGADFPGAASKFSREDWLRPGGIDWTYGIFDGSRAEPLWFEPSR